MAETWPTEAAATAAVDAAAAAAHKLGRDALLETLPPSTAARLPKWEDELPPVKMQWRQRVLPIVWAALEALPDPRHTAWLEGLYCGLRRGYEDDNPYPLAD